MKSLLSAFFSLFFAASSFSQANTWSVKFSNAMISRYTPTINAMTSKGWEYSNTIILHGMEKVYNQVNDPAYLAYVKGFIDAYLNADGSFKAGVTLVSLDRIHPGISCLFLYEQLKSNASDSLKYRTAATNLKNVLVGPSASYAPYRTPVRKIFWHKQSGYDNIMMLDGMYMAHPFLAKYGSLFGDNAAIDTAVNQTLFAYNQLYVSGTKLIKHAWKEPGSSGSVSWDDAAGNSTSVWSRATGWYMMALIDILKYVP
ncbi:MAG TPA: glycoside hydrolase family 88 protein, partial [Chitinophagaceae bacterium]|nr:glycoside hydrolase family 88 protein [Chitinophagaceae bacterium]